MQLPYLYLIAAVLIWSTNALALRLTGLEPYVVFFGSAVVATIIFGAMLVRKGEFLSFFRKSMALPLLIGVAGTINNITFFMAYKLTTVANAVFVHYFAPIVVAAFAPLLLKEKSTLRVWLAIATAIVGLFVMVDPFAGLGLGIVLAFISAIAYGFNIILQKKAVHAFTITQILFAQVFFAVIILLPWVIIEQPHIGINDGALLLLLGSVHQGAAVLMFLYAVRLLPAAKVSIITFLEPVGAVILGILFLGEVPSARTLAGGFLVLGACVLTMKGAKTKKDPL